MSFRFKPVAMMVFAVSAILGCAGGASAASVVNVLPFQNTGSNAPSHYAKGNTPYSELLQASDGNFYGTTVYGGSGLCRNLEQGGYTGCGTVFQINAKSGLETVIYNFPFDNATKTAPNGAFPTAGLIQGKDGSLYGVAQDGGMPGCNGSYGCGTLFRISTTGAFTLLHQFCGTSGPNFAPGCTGADYGRRPVNHLVQTADGTLYGVTAEGGKFGNYGTLFSATTSGAVTTLHSFLTGAGDGDNPIGALLIGHDGKTLYGTTQFGGALNGGLVFSYGPAGYTILYSFDYLPAGQPLGALIYGADGLLYGTTYSVATGGTVFSLNTAGGAFAVDATFPTGAPVTGLLLGSDGLMYGTLLYSNVVNDGGGLFVYNPTTKAAGGLVQFDAATTGGYPEGALIEGNDHYLYGSNAEGGPSNSFGAAEGTLFRIGPQWRNSAPGVQHQAFGKSEVGGTSE